MNNLIVSPLEIMRSLYVGRLVKTDSGSLKLVALVTEGRYFDEPSILFTYEDGTQEHYQLNTPINSDTD